MMMRISYAGIGRTPRPSTCDALRVGRASSPCDEVIEVIDEYHVRPMLSAFVSRGSREQ